MRPDPPPLKPNFNRVVQNIIESKTVKTNDQLRPKPQYVRSFPGLAPAGNVGTVTKPQIDVAANNAKIKRAMEARKAAQQEAPVKWSLRDEFNLRGKKL